MPTPTTGSAASEMVEWFRKEYGLYAEQEAQEQGGSDCDHLIQSAAASPPGANGTLFLPHMSTTGCPVVDAKSLGAAILAGIGVGLYKEEQDAYDQVFKPGKVYEPDPQEHARYAERFEIYKKLYPALKEINHLLR